MNASAGSAPDATATGSAVAPAHPTPLISVAIVCLNAREYLAEALDSVLAQDFDDFEVVVMDGGSTDGTIDVIRSYGPRLGERMRWRSEPDDGLYDAMNRALEFARGEYIVYLGADDHLALAALEVAARALRADPPGPEIVCGSTRVFGRIGSWIERPERDVRRGLPRHAPSRHQSLYVRREAIRAVGGFDARFRIAADYDLYLRLHAAGSTEVHVDDVLSEFRLGGVSSRSAFATAREYRDVRIAHGASRTIEQFVMMKSVLATTVFAAYRRLPASGRAAAR